MLTTIGIQRGYSPKWATVNYKEKFGEWPPRGIAVEIYVSHRQAAREIGMSKNVAARAFSEVATIFMSSIASRMTANASAPTSGEKAEPARVGSPAGSRPRTCNLRRMESLRSCPHHPRPKGQRFSAHKPRVVAKAFLPIAMARDDRPDETYMIMTCCEPWYAWPILIDNVTYFDLARRRYPIHLEIDPAVLTSVTGC
jgi:hypothetical protein